MNLNLDRKFVVETAAILGVCFGAWMLIVGSKRAELSKLEATINEAKQNPLLINATSVERMADQFLDIGDRVAEIESQSSFGQDSSHMYDLITQLATEHNLIMHRLDPGARDGGDDSPVQRSVFNMRVEGTYRHFAEFIDAVGGIDGFIRPVSLGLTPTTDGSGMVAARFSCEALSFAVPEALDRAREKYDAQQ
jgi:Tfp pilus assembly protein PilO